jgi:hypothetical protein
MESVHEGFRYLPIRVFAQHETLQNPVILEAENVVSGNGHGGIEPWICKGVYLDYLHYVPT